MRATQATLSLFSDNYNSDAHNNGHLFTKYQPFILSRFATHLILYENQRNANETPLIASYLQYKLIVSGLFSLHLFW